MNLIADTNVWYDISEGTRSPRALKMWGDRLIATPISVLEIVSGITEENFAKRRNAVRAILDHADEIIEDSESHLVSLWALEADRPKFAWKDVLLAVSQASSVVELQTGVPDPAANVKRTIGLEFLKAWRSKEWNQFNEDMEDALDQHIPGYKAARARGRRAGINRALKEPYKGVLRSDEFKRFIIGAVFQRALLAAEQPCRAPTQEEYSRGEQLLSPYVSAYIEFVISCATEFAPEPNDLGDSESFLYLQDDNRFLSRDKRWVTIGRRACPSYVYDPEENVPARRIRKRKANTAEDPAADGAVILNRKRKAKIAKRLAVASAVILLLTFVVKETLKENLKELHDSLVSAEGQFRNEQGQSTISLQILYTQGQIDNLNLEAKGGRNHPSHDYSAQIKQDVLRAQQARAQLDADFDSVSRLIDKLPATARHLRQGRDEMRIQVVEKADQDVKDVLKPNPDHDARRLIQLKLARVVALAAELPVVVLGDAALTAAQRFEELAETLIRICSWAFYVLGFCGLALGLYAAVTGIRTEDAIGGPG